MMSSAQLTATFAVVGDDYVELTVPSLHVFFPGDVLESGTAGERVFLYMGVLPVYTAELDEGAPLCIRISSALIDGHPAHERALESLLGMTVMDQFRERAATREWRDLVLIGADLEHAREALRADIARRDR